MRFSQLFTKTIKEVSAADAAKNAQLLSRGGFIQKNSAGIYTFLPLGWQVINKISAIVREEINAIDGVEILMPALVERKYLETTDRFKLDVGFDVLGKKDKIAPYALGWTHEEVLTATVSKYVNSYRDLPRAVYQIQTKFRNEARAKSGLLRGREFLMKDLYSFHTDEEDLFLYYEKVKAAYFKIFTRCGLRAFYTLAGGGDFTMSNTHEFQVLSEVGEDEILYCKKCAYAENKEISELKSDDVCRKCSGEIATGNAIEVGNIFPLGTKYAQAFNLTYKDDKGIEKFVVMGSYGIGISRLMGTIVEIFHDNSGIMWPPEVAPYMVHLIYLPADDPQVKISADRMYEELSRPGHEVLYDDRKDVRAGEKFADADLLGMPVRIVLSEKTLLNKSIEIKRRNQDIVQLCSLDSSVIFQKISA